MNVAEYLFETAAPDAIALITIDGQHSFADIAQARDCIAAYLLRRGARSGDRAVLLAENSFFWVAAYLGVLRAGLVCVPLAPKIPPEQLEYILSTTEARFAFVQMRAVGRFRSQLRGVSLITDVQGEPSALGDSSLDEIRAESTNTTFPATAPQQVAALMFTSGSTGQPRGVMVSHGNIIANTNAIIEYLQLGPRDRIMAVLPFHYCFGTSLLHTHLRAGGSLVIDPRFMFPEKILENMQATKCTGFAGVPSHYQILLRKSALARMKFPDLRYVQQAGGHLAPTFIKELQAALPGTSIFVMYGQTEATARLAYLAPELLDQKLGSIGKAIPGLMLQVLTSAGDPVRPGEVGEIVADGGNVALGYWRDPQATAAKFRDGRLYTGDLATVDEDGFIYIVDRADDFLKCGGKRVSCREIEDAILECPDVLEAVVVGMPDPILAEAAKAFVVPRDRRTGVSTEGVLNQCRLRLAPQFIPKELVVLDSLPKNSSGKVLRANLKTTQRASATRG